MSDEPAPTPSDYTHRVVCESTARKSLQANNSAIFNNLFKWDFPCFSYGGKLKWGQGSQVEEVSFRFMFRYLVLLS